MSDGDGTLNGFIYDGFAVEDQADGTWTLTEIATGKRAAFMADSYRPVGEWTLRLGDVPLHVQTVIVKACGPRLITEARS